MTRSRVVIVTPGFPTDRDESGLGAVVDLVERLAIVHDVEVVALRHPAAGPAYRLAGATVRPLGMGRRSGALGRTAVLARGVRAVLRAERRRPVDLVHGLWADEAGAVAVAAARLLRRPSIVSLMGGELARLPDIGYGAALGRGGRWTVAGSLRLSDTVTAGSHLLREAASARGGGRAVLLRPLGVDIERFDPGPRRPDPPTVLVAGALEPVKDPAAALRALAAVVRDRPGTRLELAGDGRLRAELERSVANLGLAAAVTFLGHVPRASMPDRYRAATVVLIASRHEGQSMVAVEAAASGRPVVGTRVGVLPELGAGAETVAVGDASGLAAALAGVLDDDAKASAMGEAGRAVAIERFAIERTVDALLDDYTRLISRAGRGGADRP
jgi:glycosyltransferase involved in cell wall biosynthesis